MAGADGSYDKMSNRFYAGVFVLQTMQRVEKVTASEEVSMAYDLLKVLTANMICETSNRQLQKVVSLNLCVLLNRKNLRCPN